MGQFVSRPRRSIRKDCQPSDRPTDSQVTLENEHMTDRTSERPGQKRERHLYT